MEQKDMDMEEAKHLGRTKLQLALDNLVKAEEEGAEHFAPDTYVWAKNKIYEARKIILKNYKDQKIVDEASDDACAAAAQLLSAVLKQKEQNEKKGPTVKEAVKVLVNEGGPVL